MTRLGRWVYGCRMTTTQTKGTTMNVTPAQARLLAATDLRPAAADVDNLWPDHIVRMTDAECAPLIAEYEALAPEGMNRRQWLALCQENDR